MEVVLDMLVVVMAAMVGLLKEVLLIATQLTQVRIIFPRIIICLRVRIAVRLCRRHFEGILQRQWGLRRSHHLKLDALVFNRLLHLIWIFKILTTTTSMIAYLTPHLEIVAVFKTIRTFLTSATQTVQENPQCQGITYLNLLPLITIPMASQLC